MTTQVGTDVKVRALARGFDDPAVEPQRWGRLLSAGDTDVPFLTPGWQRAWWQTFGAGQLVLVVAERGDEPFAILPLYADGEMLYLVASSGSDELDIVGDVGDGRVLAAMIAEAVEFVGPVRGLVVYHVPERSRTTVRLSEAAHHLGWRLFDEGSLRAPALDLGCDGSAGVRVASKTSLRRHERGLARDGSLRVTLLRDAQDVLPWLQPFFEQHVDRWAATPYPSLFCDEEQRHFYERVAIAGGSEGWLRFAVVEWDDRPIAFHFGTSRGGRFLWYKPSFAIDLARRSPGEVLLRSLLLGAVAEGVRMFDFGLGDEAFKLRFSDQVSTVTTWGLYP